ncbi:hypothetical protein [Arenibacter amylolyticus]|uniref:hypothetical protein n=1 Tax=Arenibacter amylolyticus TaxID=1406873 RepID=UPI000A380957|nr:hypothetical protein [Arenibacter amylolyticus]
MRNLLIAIFLLNCFLGMSQAELNKYKYIIVPVKLDAFKQENQYQTSTLIKYLLVENGFNAVYDNAMPEDLLNNRCLGLVLSLNDDSSMFTTKLTLSLKDCFSKEVYVTKEGRSKEKDFKAAYSGAIKESMQSLSDVDYQYQPAANKEPVTISFKDDVKRISQTATQAPKNSTHDPVVQQKATLKEQSYKDLTPAQSDFKQGEGQLTETATQVKNVVESDVLYAQAIPNGYQLVDSTPKIVMILQQTSFSNFYMAKPNWQEANGILYKRGGNWVFEYYEGGELMNKKMNIKF